VMMANEKEQKISKSNQNITSTATVHCHIRAIPFIHEWAGSSVQQRGVFLKSDQ
jgi:hypothetical protein